jgi:hypothetical protein
MGVVPGGFGFGFGQSDAVMRRWPSDASVRHGGKDALLRTVERSETQTTSLRVTP